MALLNQFCQRFDLIFVENWQQAGKPVYSFLDFHGKRKVYDPDTILKMLSLTPTP